MHKFNSKENGLTKVVSQKKSQNSLPNKLFKTDGNEQQGQVKYVLVNTVPKKIFM